MERHQLQAFVAIVEMGSFVKAADRLGVAQPSISQSLKGLEDSLGVVLMHRSRAGIELTGAGEALLPSAKAALHQMDEGARRAKLAALGMMGVLRVGFLGSATAPFLPGLIQRFREDFPTVSLDLRELTPRAQVEAFLNHEVDVACGHPLPIALQSRFHSRTIYDDPLWLVVPKGHPLTLKAALEPEDLCCRDYVMFSREDATGLMQGVMGYLAGLGAAVNVVSEPREMATVILLVASGMGVSIVPGCTRHLRSPGVVYLPLPQPAPSIPLQASWPKESTDPLVKNWIQTIVNEKERILEVMSGVSQQAAEIH